MCTLANSEDPDEMPHNAPFHQSTLFSMTKMIFRERNTVFVLKVEPVTPQYIQWTIPILLFQTKGRIPKCIKGY